MSQQQYAGETYSTGELARKCGVTVRTVQYYDQRGILVPNRLTEGGRRVYTEADARKLELLTYLRHLGLSIDSIGKIYREDNADKVVETLLTEQIRVLTEETRERSAKLKEARAFLSGLRSAGAYSPESMQDIAAVMSRKNDLKRIRRSMWLFAGVMGLVEYGSLIYAIATGRWAVFLMGMLLVILACIPFFYYYTSRIYYICPECHAVFRGRRWEVLWARHTYTTRKLTCPRCGKKSWCVETPAAEGE